MILAGDLAAGGKLNEAGVADSLGVSRGPVREAFRALEESGLVRLEKNRGVFVRQISVDEADEIYEVRAVARRMVGRRARADRRPPSRSASCARASSGWNARRRKDDVDALLPRSTSTSTTGWSRSPATPSCSRPTAAWSTSSHLFRRATLAQGGTLPVSTREHRDIVDRIAAGNAAAAGRALLRSRHGEPRADAPEPRRSRLARARAAASPSIATGKSR